ncbi:hypothetical protein [Acidisphaera sp. L21]|uniref:hypothetical protein n=1 Tax=Acidisphaera sp. L21 TaxID=1641851 RepID=UPI00131ADCBA|nr:hypothetical protein [Acidisphaera sp. L21]
MTDEFIAIFDVSAAIGGFDVAIGAGAGCEHAAVEMHRHPARTAPQDLKDISTLPLSSGCLHHATFAQRGR